MTMEELNHLEAVGQHIDCLSSQLSTTKKYKYLTVLLRGVSYTFNAGTATYDIIVGALEKELCDKQSELASWSTSTTESNLKM